MVGKSASSTNVRNASSCQVEVAGDGRMSGVDKIGRSEEHTSELQSPC